MKMTSEEMLAAKLQRVAQGSKDPKVRQAAQRHSDGLLAAWNAKRKVAR